MGLVSVLEEMDLDVSIEQHFLRAKDHVEDGANDVRNAESHAKIGFSLVEAALGRRFACVRVDARALPAVVENEERSMFAFDACEEIQQLPHVFARQHTSHGHRERVAIDANRVSTQVHEAFVPLTHDG